MQGLLVLDPTDIEASCKRVEEVFLASPLPPDLEEQLLTRLAEEPYSGRFLAVRSSGTDEDTGAHSFAGGWGMGWGRTGWQGWGRSCLQGVGQELFAGGMAGGGQELFGGVGLELCAESIPGVVCVQYNLWHSVAKSASLRGELNCCCLVCRSI